MLKLLSTGIQQWEVPSNSSSDVWSLYVIAYCTRTNVAVKSKKSHFLSFVVSYHSLVNPGLDRLDNSQELTGLLLMLSEIENRF